jgi:translation initiation factor IF-2
MAVGGPNPAMPKPAAAPKPGKPKSSAPAPAKDNAILSDGETRAAKPPKPGAAPKPGGGLGALLGAALAGGKPGALPMGGMSAPARPRPSGLAIGQRPQLGARTKAAMKPAMKRGR